MGVVLSGLVSAASPEQPEPVVSSPPDFVSFGGERAKTDPSRNAVMGFPVPTQVKEVLVKGGQRVAKGDLMIRGDVADVLDQAVLDHSLAKMQHAQAILGVDRAQARVDRLQLVAPFDGVIDLVSVDVGQAVSENDKALRIVDVDPLWIAHATPISRALCQRQKH